MNQQQLREVYEMVDGIPFTRSKKNINRDFSDGVMMAELIHHYRPKDVQLHNYPTTSTQAKKINNWNTLNSKVLKKLGIGLAKNEIEDIVNCVPLAIETYLYEVLKKFESPAEEVNIRQQIKKVQPVESKGRQASKVVNTNHQNSIITVANLQSKETMKEMKPQQQQTLGLGNETDQVFQLIEEIQDAYAELLKLQQKSKMKDEVIRNLEKKIEKMIFS